MSNSVLLARSRSSAFPASCPVCPNHQAAATPPSASWPFLATSSSRGPRATHHSPLFLNFFKDFQANPFRSRVFNFYSGGGGVSSLQTPPCSFFPDFSLISFACHSYGKTGGRGGGAPSPSADRPCAALASVPYREQLFRASGGHTRALRSRIRYHRDSVFSACKSTLFRASSRPFSSCAV